MQSTTIQQSHANIIEEVKSWFNQWAELNHRAITSVSRRDPDDMLPIIMILFWIIVGICIVVCTSFGVAYHYAVFKSVSGSTVWGLVAAALFLLAVEVTTVFLGLYFFDALLEKMWFRSVKRGVLFIGIGIIVFVAVRWSINISTEGVAAVNQQQKTDDAYKESVYEVPGEVLELDTKIADAQATIETAKKSTWRGRPTKESLDIIEANTTLKINLEQQRALMVSNGLSRRDSVTVFKIKEATFLSTLLVDYGGKAEYGKLFGLFMISLIGSIMREKLDPETGKT